MATLAAFSAVLTVVSVSPCGAAQGQALAAVRQKLPLVTVLKPLRRTAVYTITLPGDLIGYYESALHAKVTGYVKQVYVDKGDLVTKGQAMAEIEVPELAANIERQRARVVITRLTYQRLRRVWRSDHRLVAREAVDIAYAKYAEAKGELGILTTLEGYTKIVAPYDGVITGRFADPGALIRAGGGHYGISGTGAFVTPSVTEGSGGHLYGGGPVLSIARIDRLRCYVYVPENVAPAIYKGMPALIRVRALPERGFKAQVARFASSLDLSTRTMLVELDLDNPRHRLYPRMYAKVTLELERHPNAIELPAAAVRGVGGKASVLVVRQGKVIELPVTAGITDGRFTEIVKGLGAEELVASNYSNALADKGEEVTPVLMDIKQVVWEGELKSLQSDADE